VEKSLPNRKKGGKPVALPEESMSFPEEKESGNSTKRRIMRRVGIWACRVIRSEELHTGYKKRTCTLDAVIIRF